MVGILLFFLSSLTFLLVGRLNADEGWYLLASRLVMEGQIPYRDFAFTQMPLLPYVYGIPQSIFPSSILLGRAISVVFSITAFAIWIVIARKRSGVVGASATSLLLATFTYGSYYHAIVKPYALLTCLFALTFLALTYDTARSWPRVAAVAFAIGAALVRLPAIPFAAVIFAYVLATTQSKRAKRAVAILGGVSALLFLALVSLDLSAARWNLFGHHLGQWGAQSNLTKLRQILFSRAPDLLVSFLPYVLLAIVIVLYLRRKGLLRETFGQKGAVFVVGVCLFGMSHFVTGGWHIEYFVPMVFSLLPFLAMGFAAVYLRPELSFTGKILIRVALFAILISELIRGGTQLVDVAREQVPYQAISEISDQVRKITAPEDSVFALEALWTLIGSERQPLPGMTMAQFSYFDGDTTEAVDLELVNKEMILKYISEAEAEVVLLTDLDWFRFETIGITERVGEALDDCYAPFLERDNTSNHDGKLTIYRRLDRCRDKET